LDRREREMRLRYSAHAEEKIRIRKLSKDEIRLTLEDPDYRFYDVATNANVAVKEIVGPGEKIGLVVVFTVTREGFRIVTVFPVKDLSGEIRRKVNSRRWLSLAR